MHVTVAPVARVCDAQPDILALTLAWLLPLAGGVVGSGHRSWTRGPVTDAETWVLITKAGFQKKETCTEGKILLQ